MIKFSSGDIFESILDAYFQDRSENNFNFLRRCFEFYFAPTIKFYLHTISYLIFLIIFSIFIATDLDPSYFSRYEYLVWIWAITMWVEEIQQYFDAESNNYIRKLYLHFKERWNIYDQLCFSTLLIAVVLRCVSSQKYHEIASTMYALALVLFILRILQFFYFTTTYGPEVVILFGMLKDLPFFFFVFGVFLFAYGIPAHALLYPKYSLNGDTLLKVISSPYFAVYGQYDDLGNLLTGDCVYDNQTSFGYVSAKPRYSLFVLLLFSVYLLISGILLINLLIAILNSTYNKEESSSERKWMLNETKILKEFIQKSCLVPPFVILSHISCLVIFVAKSCGATFKSET